MQHEKRGHQEPTALKPNCNIPFSKHIFLTKTRKIRRCSGHKHTMGQIPTHRPVTGFINSPNKILHNPPQISITTIVITNHRIYKRNNYTCTCKFYNKENRLTYFPLHRNFIQSK